jgi:hypothetical protein
VATVDRTTDLETFLDSPRQTHRHFRVVVVDRMPMGASPSSSPARRSDGRTSAPLAASVRATPASRSRATSSRSRTTIAAMRPTSERAEVRRRSCWTATGRRRDDGAMDPSWERNAAVLDPNNLALRDLVHDLPAAGARRTGRPSTSGSVWGGTLWSSGEEIEYARALRSALASRTTRGSP